MRSTTIAAALALAAVHAFGASASAVTIGDPIASGTPGGGQLETYKVQDLRVPDADGGPPWALATFNGRPHTVRRRSLATGCVEVGRIVDGRIGALTPEDVFRPYQPMSGLSTFCGVMDPTKPGFAIGHTLAMRPALLAPPCSPTPIPPSFPGRQCDPDEQRTIVVGGLGRGILGASLSPRQRGRSVATTPDGLFLAVMRGTFTEATEPILRVRATVCGPDARTDISGVSTRRKGCEVTFAIPDTRPAVENRASRRNRRAAALDAPVRIVERRGTSSIGRFSARITLPITVRASTEGYAYRLTGPAGRGCKATRTADATRDPISSFLMVHGHAYDLPILPLDQTRGGWCRGTYRIAFYFTNARDQSAKRVASTTFRVTR